MSNEIPYQVGPQVEALKQERANCVAYGNDTRVASIDRQLVALGVKQEAAQERAAASEGDDGAKSATPKGRRSQPQTTTAEGE